MLLAAGLMCVAGCRLDVRNFQESVVVAFSGFCGCEKNMEIWLG